MPSRTDFCVEHLPADRPPYQVDVGACRFDQRNNMSVGRPNWDESIQKYWKRMGETRASNPSNSIPKSARTWSGPSISSNPGHYTWHINPETCRKYQALGSADNCTVCIRVCPFTKNPGWVHDLTRMFIARVPALNRVWRKMDGLMGYGKQTDPGLFWKESR